MTANNNCGYWKAWTNACISHMNDVIYKPNRHLMSHNEQQENIT